MAGPDGLASESERTFPEVETRPPVAQTAAERAEEAKLIRRIEWMIRMVMQVIAQDPSLTVDEASQMVADARNAALATFPDKALAFDMIFRPRLQRLMRERYRLQ